MRGTIIKTEAQMTLFILVIKGRKFIGAATSKAQFIETVQERTGIDPENGNIYEVNYLTSWFFEVSGSITIGDTGLEVK